MTFLEKIAVLIRERYENPRDLVVVFPNRRAGLFLKQIMKEQSNRPAWSPDIVSFQDLINRESPLKLGDPVLLIHKLYQVYKNHLPLAESEGFERFYYWGKMLLQDFDEIDKYLVNGGLLYRNLRNQKELDMTFDFLTDEQRDILRQFWEGFENKRSDNKEQFLRTWEKLGDIYQDYRQLLKAEGLAYEGLLYRELAENIEDHDWKYQRKHVLFAGFNALTTAEEKIIAWCLQNGDTRVEWDVDAYYMENREQEAGRFFREYRRRPYFERTFPDPVPDRLTTAEREMEIHGVPQNVGQARYMGQKLRQLLHDNPGLEKHRIAIVLADESLLLPVLHSLPNEAGSINVTMGFPLSYAPVNSLIEYFTDLQVKFREEKGFYYLPVLGILRHPLIAPRFEDANSIIRDIEKKNGVYVKPGRMTRHNLGELIFRYAGDDFLDYVIAILKYLEQDKETDGMNRIFIHHYRRHFTRYRDIMENESDQPVSVQSFRRLFRQLANTEKVPFTGEPLRGIQIMGVLETRNLDFEHVFVLSCNEGSLPSGARQHSFIPYNIRKAYQLPHFDQQDAMYSYLFYRLIQSVKTALFTWDTEGNDFGEEEMSRFLRQLQYEFPQKARQTVLANDIAGAKPEPIVMERTEAVRARLAGYLDGSRPRGISPSAINTYLECRLRFFFRHIAGLRETDEVEEDLDARSLGNVLHLLVELLYQEHQKKHGLLVRKEHFGELRGSLEHILQEAFSQNYNLGEGEQFDVEGKNRIAWEIIMSFAGKIMDRDEAYAPFEIVGLEEEFDVFFRLDNERTVKMSGKVDRVDRKNDLIRIIDYKTGRDEQLFKSIQGLFGKDHSKVAFQTLLYTLLYKISREEKGNLAPHVFNRAVLFGDEDSGLRMGSKNNFEYLDPVNPYLEEFSDELKGLLEEIFYSDQPFDQTEDDKKCTYCEFNVMCRRTKE